MKDIQTIPDLFVEDISVFNDQRGSYTKIFCALDFSSSFNTREISLVKIEPKFLRGGKVQTLPYTADKLFYCIDGDVTQRVVDLRRGSPAYGKAFDFTLKAKKPQLLFIPKGCVNWAYSELGALFVYAQTADYHKESEIIIDINKLKDFDSPFIYGKT